MLNCFMQCYIFQNCDSTVVCEKDGSPWKDGCKNANESLEDYLRRMEQLVANVSLEHHAGKKLLRVIRVNLSESQTTCKFFVQTSIHTYVCSP